MNRCTYNDRPRRPFDHPEKGITKDNCQGYLYQLVYSCRTCYNSLIEDKLKDLVSQNKEEGKEGKTIEEIAEMPVDEMVLYYKSLKQSDQTLVIDSLKE